MSLLDRVNARPLAESEDHPDPGHSIGAWLREKREAGLPKKLTNEAVSKKIPMFVEGSPSKDDHKCGGCQFAVPGPREWTCSLVYTTVDQKNGSCAYWSGGEPNRDAKFATRQMSADEAQYVEVPAGMKINCASCKFYRQLDVVEQIGTLAEGADSKHTGACALFHGRVHTYDCCMAWNNRAAKMPG